MVKSIIKRIIVSVGVILCLGYLSTYFGIGLIQVNASEIPIQVSVQEGSSDNLITQDGITSNIHATSDEHFYQNELYFYAIAPSDCPNQGDSCGIKNSPYPGYIESVLTSPMSIPQSEYNNTYIYGSALQTDFYNQFELQSNTHYSYMLLVKKSRRNILYMNNYPISTEISVYVPSNNDYDTSFDLSVFNLETTYHIQHINTNGSQGEYAYFQVEFDTPDLDDFHGGQVFLNYIKFFYSTPHYYVESPFPGWVYTPNGSDNQLSFNTYFIENGLIQFTGVDCSQLTNTCHNGVAFIGGMDNVSADDIQVLESIPQCDNTDIVCHIRRVFEMISRFFTRFGNWFSKFWSNTIDWDLDTNSDMTPVSNILTMPLTLINNMLTGFSGTCQSYSLPQLFGYTIVFPCINLEERLGVFIWGIIDGLVSLFMIFNIGRLIITFFDKSTSLDDMFGLLYHMRDSEAREADDYVNGVVR